MLFACCDFSFQMVADANNILKLFNPKVPLPPNPKYAINTYHEEFEDDFKLDAAAVFNSWYNTRIHYDYDNPKQSKNTGKFIVQHIMFIIAFLKLLN